MSRKALYIHLSRFANAEPGRTRLTTLYVTDISTKTAIGHTVENSIAQM